MFHVEQCLPQHLPPREGARSAPAIARPLETNRQSLACINLKEIKDLGTSAASEVLTFPVDENTGFCSY
jgi:hypothetical protein